MMKILITFIIATIFWIAVVSNYYEKTIKYQDNYNSRVASQIK